MAVGLHTVKVFTDPAAGGWSAPMASNPYLNTDAAGWRAGPFTTAWTWAGGAVTGGTHLVRAETSPVARVAAGAYRLRVVFTLGTAGNVFWGVNFGTTPRAAEVGPFWDANAVHLWQGRTLAPGTYAFESTWDPSTVDAGYVYLGPYVQFPTGSVGNRVDTVELRYQGSGGIDLSCLVDTVAIHHGRDDAAGQPEASAATLDLTTDAATALPADVEVGAVVSITTTTARAVSTRFVGRITDVSLGWDEAGQDTPDAGVAQIIATGILADLGRRVVGDVPWPQELDGARVDRVMTAAGITLDPLMSDPGTVQLLARDVDSTAALDASHDAAESASGILWQTRGGEVRYADATHRRGTPITLELDACDILVTPTWRRNTDGLVNSVSVGYGVTPEGGEQPRFTEANAASMTKWGTYAYTAATELATLADAQALGRLLLTRNSYPVWVMAALPVDTEGLDAERYDALLGLDMHALVNLTGLPAIGTAPTSAVLWVEGWRETLTYGGHEVELVVSGYCRTAPAPRWDDLTPATTWDNAPDITWDEAACLGPPANLGRWNDQPATLRWDQVPPAKTWNTFT